MNFAPLLPVTFCRMPSSAFHMSYTRIDLRDMRVVMAFPLAHCLPSTSSASAGVSPAALFGSFFGTMQRSDFPPLLLIVVCPWASRCAVPRTVPSAVHKTAGPPGSRAKCLRACTGSVTARGPVLPRQCASSGVAFGMSPLPRRPGPPVTFAAGHGFRGSTPAPRVLLSTLRPHPCECVRMTRSRFSWLSLQRMKLSCTTLRRF